MLIIVLVSKIVVAVCCLVGCYGIITSFTVKQYENITIQTICITHYVKKKGTVSGYYTFWYICKLIITIRDNMVL